MRVPQKSKISTVSFGGCCAMLCVVVVISKSILKQLAPVMEGWVD